MIYADHDIRAQTRIDVLRRQLIFTSTEYRQYSRQELIRCVSMTLDMCEQTPPGSVSRVRAIWFFMTFIARDDMIAFAHSNSRWREACVSKIQSLLSDPVAQSNSVMNHVLHKIENPPTSELESDMWNIRSKI